MAAISGSMGCPPRPRRRRAPRGKRAARTVAMGRGIAAGIIVGRPVAGREVNEMDRTVATEETDASAAKPAPVLSVRNLHTYFSTAEGVVKAVNGVNLDLYADRTLGLVGESGSGKSVAALSILKLIQSPGRVVAGEVDFEGRDLLKLKDEQLRQVRGKDVAIIFQDSPSGLNPTMRVGWQVEEAVIAHDLVKQVRSDRQALNALREAGIP